MKTESLEYAIMLTPEKIKTAQKNAETLINLHKTGALGGETMPEDANPGLPKNSEENLLYFTLTMALNYQRNSYRLWESALQTYNDPETNVVFSPQGVVSMDNNLLGKNLLKYGLALQPIKHPQIWAQLCKTFFYQFNGKVGQFFAINNYSVKRIKDYMIENKKMFPYLSGPKIMNYWLYIIEQYSDINLLQKEFITVAPDTHVLQASVKLGLINHDDIKNPNIREIVSELWQTILAGTKWNPIDIHTPLWLWSRGGFAVKL